MEMLEFSKKCDGAQGCLFAHCIEMPCTGNPVAPPYAWHCHWQWWLFRKAGRDINPSLVHYCDNPIFHGEPCHYCGSVLEE